MSKSKRSCFVVGPIGDEDSNDRTHADWLLEEIIRPVFKSNYSGIRLERADKIATPGRIDSQVISALLDANLVIADLSYLNPNAFYEIGIRHMVQKPIIHMHLDGEKIPFDVGAFRSIKFSLTRPKDLQLARDALSAAVEEALSEDHKVDNPVTVARGKLKFEATASDADQVLLKEIKMLGGRVFELEESSKPIEYITKRKRVNKGDIINFVNASKDQHTTKICPDCNYTNPMLPARDYICADCGLHYA